MAGKGRAIAYRLDKAEEEKLDSICSQTELTPSEITRRAMKFFLKIVEREGSIAFLFDGMQIAALPSAEEVGGDAYFDELQSAAADLAKILHNSTDPRRVEIFRDGGTLRVAEIDPEDPVVDPAKTKY